MRFRPIVVASMVLLSVALEAAAQSTAHQIPYQGRLELDGVAISGSYDFWFELYPTPTGGDCLATPPPHADCLWADELLDVTVTGGDFSVLLGSVANPLGDAIWQNAEVYLGIRVAAAGDAYTPLAGRQRVLAVPMAARADTAKNYHVTGTLQVDGGATVGGALTTRAILPRYQAWGSQGTGDGGAGIYNDDGTFDRLMLVGNTAAGGSTRRVGIWDDLFVSNDLDVGGRLVPDFDSGWTAVNSATQNEVSFTHNFGAIPSNVVLQQCGAVSGVACTTRVVLAGVRGYQDGTAFINPVAVTATTTQIYVALTVSWWTWGYWVPGVGWQHPGDADNNPGTGFYRVLAWR